jgi:hypothetical protein
MAINVELSGVELSKYLATNLNDLEFEMLVRERIRMEFEAAHSEYPQFSESHNSCRFVFEWNDQCKWNVGVGSTYRDAISIAGEVLHGTVVNAVRQYEMQNGNKLSKLLPAPTRAEDIIRTFDDDNC